MRGRTWVGLVATAAAVVIAVAIAVLVLGSSDGGETPVTVRSNSLVLIDADDNRVVDSP